MKYFKSIFTTLTFLMLLSCNLNTDKTNESPKPNFKVDKNGLENILKKEFDFKNLKVGTYITKKDGVKETGLNLTFEKESLNSLSDSLVADYSTIIKKSVTKNLLHLEDYDFINITFESKMIEGGLTKSNSIQLKKQL